VAIRLFVTLISKFADSVLPRRQVRSNVESVSKLQSIPSPVQWSRLLPSAETEFRLNGVCACGEVARVLADEMFAHCTMPASMKWSMRFRLFDRNKHPRFVMLLWG
jgi:hypothetical protein